MDRVHVHVGVPSDGDWKARTGAALCGLFAYFYCTPLKQYSGGQALSLSGAFGSILPQLRTNIVRKAQEVGADYLLFVDSDQTFPLTILHRLLGWELDIVACNVAVKTLPSQATARNFVDGKWVPVQTRPKQTRLEYVERIGTGIMLVKMSVFDRIAPPWFQITWNEQIQDFEGEDWYFVRKCTEAGIPIAIDHGVSQEVGHIGNFEFKHCHVIPAAEQEEKTEKLVMEQPSE